MVGRRSCSALIAVAGLLLLVHCASALPSHLLSKQAPDESGDLLSDAAAAGHNSASVVGELWALGSGGDDEVSKARIGQGRELNSQKRTVLQKLRLAKAFKRRAQIDGDAISVGLDQKLVSLPSCKCSQHNGWNILKQAKAQVLAEEGEAANGDCPCQPSVVGAVTEVLEQKLQQLQMELGSKTAASLALRKALVSMRLPSMLSQDLVQELDAMDGLGDSTNGTVAPACGTSCDEPPASGGDGGVHVTVNSYIPNEWEEYEKNMTTTQPYFNSYQYPASYLSRPEKTTVASSPGGPGVTNVVVNVNNNIYMAPPPPPPQPLPACHPYCAPYLFKTDKTSTLHTAEGDHVPSHVSKPRVSAAQPPRQAVHAAQHADNVQSHAHSLRAAVGAPGQAGPSAGKGAAREADKAKALASKIEKAAKQARLQSEGEGARQAQAGGHNGEEWEAARRRLVDTALSLERIARERAEALRRSVAVQEAAAMASLAPTQQLEQLEAPPRAASEQLAARKGAAGARGPRGATPVESAMAPVLRLPVDEADRSGKVAVPVVKDKESPPPLKGQLQRMGVLGIDGGAARKDLFSYFDASAARHGGMAAQQQGSGGERRERKGRRAAADGAGLLQESDSAARTDLMAYFDAAARANGPSSAAQRDGAAGSKRGGRAEKGRGRAARKGEGQLAEVSDSAARSDLVGYFDTLATRSAGYTKAEEERARRGRMRGAGADAARKQLMGYFDAVARQSKMYTKEEEMKRHT